jgi:NTP pyrophosphatase (non-canonical NTP hydrolase)
MSQSNTYAPPLTIGADDLPGVAKIVEECGEYVQVVGKLLATDGRAEHWDGTDLHVRLVEEAGDILAAIRYFAEANDIGAVIELRADQKLALFRRWHAEAQG